MTAQPQTLRRDTKPSLEFEGWTLSHVSTWLPNKLRWTELTIWAVDHSERAMWVVEVVGRSSVDGETDRRDAVPCDTVEDLRTALSRGGVLTAPGRLVLEQAAAEDDELKYAMDSERTERL